MLFASRLAVCLKVRSWIWKVGCTASSKRKGMPQALLYTTATKNGSCILARHGEKLDSGMCRTTQSNLALLLRRCSDAVTCCRVSPRASETFFAPSRWVFFVSRPEWNRSHARRAHPGFKRVLLHAVWLTCARPHARWRNTQHRFFPSCRPLVSQLSGDDMP